MNKWGEEKRDKQTQRHTEREMSLPDFRTKIQRCGMGAKLPIQWAFSLA